VMSCAVVGAETLNVDGGRASSAGCLELLPAPDNDVTRLNGGTALCYEALADDAAQAASSALKTTAGELRQ